MNLTTAESVSCGQDEPRARYQQLTTDSAVSCTSSHHTLKRQWFPSRQTPPHISCQAPPRPFSTLTCCLWCPFSFPLFHSKLPSLQCASYSSLQTAADSSALLLLETGLRNSVRFSRDHHLSPRYRVGVGRGEERKHHDSSEKNHFSLYTKSLGQNDGARKVDSLVIWTVSWKEVLACKCDTFVTITVFFWLQRLR